MRDRKTSSEVENSPEEEEQRVLKKSQKKVNDTANHCVCQHNRRLIFFIQQYFRLKDPSETYQARRRELSKKQSSPQLAQNR
jgi:hypothetical protein